MHGQVSAYAVLLTLLTALLGLVGWGLRLIVKGRLVPGQIHKEICDDLQRQRDRSDREAEKWQRAFFGVVVQSEEQQEIGRTVRALMDALTKSVEDDA